MFNNEQIFVNIIMSLFCGGVSIKDLVIQQLCYNMKTGITEPKFAILDDGTQAVVKLFNGPEGNLVLFNEYLCYRMAILLNIPMPRSGICMMNKDTIIQDATIADINNYGKAFYSQYMNKTTRLLPTIIKMVDNREVFLKILLFDHIIFNSDRNEGNLLVSFYKNEKSIKVIDHTHVFINQAIWDSRCLERAIAEKDLLKTDVLESNKTLYNMFLNDVLISKELLKEESLYFKSKLNHDTIVRLIDEVPKEWRPSQEDIDALVKYLMYRIDNIDIILSTIINFYGI